MGTSRFKWMLYVILIVIIGTIASQVYWNFKNYQNNKQQLINDVQLSLDNSVEHYFAKLAQQHTVGFAFDASNSRQFLSDTHLFDTIIGNLKISKDGIKGLDSIDMKIDSSELKVYRGIRADSLRKSLHLHKTFPDLSKERLHINDLKVRNIDSANSSNFEMLTSKIVVSLTHDSLDIKDIDSLFNKDLQSKKLSINHKLFLTVKDEDSINTQEELLKKADLYVVSKSPFLPQKNELFASFTNTTKEILKRSLSGILLSTLLILAVISCLFYLLRVIKHQKQLAEIKNDLISNITHEFKTPIATIGVALESIKDFNVINDKTKTKKYLDMSGSQLSKLNTMVEKLLETATLDSEVLDLHKDKFDIIGLIQQLADKHQISNDEKSIAVTTDLNALILNADEFHIENAINNVIDNAVKYGGDEISIQIEGIASKAIISISDSGTSLKASDKANIFEKFYRVPKGNTHNVKGFGIGLYYTKKIIEKHNGTIDLVLNNKQTVFKISLPNV